MRNSLDVLAPAAFLLCLLAPGGSALAHEGHVHKSMGTITAIDATSIEVESKSDTGTSRIAITINEQTKYLAGKEAARAADARVGSRVVVIYVEQSGQKVAREILLPPRPAGADAGQPHPPRGSGERKGRA